MQKPPVGESSAAWIRSVRHAWTHLPYRLRGCVQAVSLAGRPQPVPLQSRHTRSATALATTPEQPAVTVADGIAASSTKLAHLGADCLGGFDQSPTGFVRIDDLKMEPPFQNARGLESATMLVRRTVSLERLHRFLNDYDPPGSAQ